MLPTVTVECWQVNGFFEGGELAVGNHCSLDLEWMLNESRRDQSSIKTKKTPHALRNKREIGFSWQGRHAPED
jgi:hypothetical protein